MGPSGAAGLDGQDTLEDLAIDGFIIMTLVADGVWLWQYRQDLQGDRMGRGLPEKLWGDFEATFAAIRKNSRPADILWSQRQMVYPLYTDRKTLAYNFVPLNLDTTLHQEAIMAERMAIIRNSGVRYIILEPQFQKDGSFRPADLQMADWLSRAPHSYRSVYVSPHKWVQVYEILPVSTR